MKKGSGSAEIAFQSRGDSGKKNMIKKKDWDNEFEWWDEKAEHQLVRKDMETEKKVLVRGMKKGAGNAQRVALVRQGGKRRNEIPNEKAKD